MEFLLIFGVHFFIMGSASMLLSLVVSSVAKKIPFFSYDLGLYALRCHVCEYDWLFRAFMVDRFV